MKTNQPNHTPGRTLSILFIATMTLLLSACSQKMNFAISSVVPAAEGSVKIKKDNNSNYSIELDVIRLAEASRLTPPKGMYIVWMETEQNGVMNIGQLNVADKIGSGAKMHKISLETTTTFKPSNFFITAEDDANITYPAGQTVLSTIAN